MVCIFNADKIISDEVDELGRARFLATHFQQSTGGYNYRMSNILGGVGRAQLEVLDERVEAKRTVFTRYEEALGG